MIENNKYSYCSKISKTTIRRIALIFTFDLNASQIANPFLPSPPNTVTSAPLLWTKEPWDSANRKILWTVILELMKASLVIASIITIWCSGAWENPMYIYTWENGLESLWTHAKLAWIFWSGCVNIRFIFT